MLEFLKAPFLVLHFSYYTLDLPDDVICNITTYADDTTLHSMCEQAPDLWQQLELTSGLASDQRDTIDWAGNSLSISMLKKINLFLLTCLITLVLLT